MRDLAPRGVNRIENLGAFLRSWLGADNVGDSPSPASRRSRFGNINLAGDDWASESQLLPFRHAAFTESIEPGVRALAMAFVDLGTITYTSCEGHFYTDREPDELHVGALIRNDAEAGRLERLWQRMEPVVGLRFDLGIMRHAVESRDRRIRALDFYLLKPTHAVWQEYFSTRVAAAELIAARLAADASAGL
ncbi:hypothetical protein BH10PSE14_BH10PSE14_22170 [soil metagenome]